MWNGKADTLKAKPTSTKMIPSVMIIAEESGSETASLISCRSVLPETPNTSDMPYSMIAEAKTPIR